MRVVLAICGCFRLRRSIIMDVILMLSVGTINGSIFDLGPIGENGLNGHP